MRSLRRVNRRVAKRVETVARSVVEADDDIVRSVSIRFTERWEKRGQELGVYLPFVYMNDASRDQNPLASYGSKNLARLVKVSQKYDSKRVFQKLQNDGFLLSKL